MSAPRQPDNYNLDESMKQVQAAFGKLRSFLQVPNLKMGDILNVQIEIVAEHVATVYSILIEIAEKNISDRKFEVFRALVEDAMRNFNQDCGRLSKAFSGGQYNLDEKIETEAQENIRSIKLCFARSLAAFNEAQKQRFQSSTVIMNALSVRTTPEQKWDGDVLKENITAYIKEIFPGFDPRGQGNKISFNESSMELYISDKSVAAQVRAALIDYVAPTPRGHANNPRMILLGATPEFIKHFTDYNPGKRPLSEAQAQTQAQQTTNDDGPKRMESPLSKRPR